MSDEMQIYLTIQVWKEGNTYVSYSPELDVSSCGKAYEEAKENLHEAIELFLEEAERMGTLKEILEEAGFIKQETGWIKPQMKTTVEKMQFVLP